LQDQCGFLASLKRTQRSTGSQTVGSLERQHPPWILTGKSADTIQLPKLVLGECELDRREIVLKLVEALHGFSLPYRI
jgi:hypothetical protein